MSGYATVLIEGVPENLDTSHIIVAPVMVPGIGKMKITLYLTAGNHESKTVASYIPYYGDISPGLSIKSAIEQNNRAALKFNSSETTLFSGNQKDVCFQTLTVMTDEMPLFSQKAPDSPCDEGSSLGVPNPPQYSRPPSDSSQKVLGTVATNEKSKKRFGIFRRK